MLKNEPPFRYGKQCIPSQQYGSGPYPTSYPANPYPKNPVYTTKAPAYPANPGYLSKPPVYQNTAACPWSKLHYGDCGSTYPDRCSLKYFRFCGEYFFNQVYNDVCRWQDSVTLIPLFTATLVPLGYRFENSYGVKCVGYGTHSGDYLYGGTLPLYDRDVPKCHPDAGAPPCRFLDFTGITTARQFHIRMQELYHYWLKTKCNHEFQAELEISIFTKI